MLTGKLKLIILYCGWLKKPRGRIQKYSDTSFLSTFSLCNKLKSIWNCLFDEKERWK